MADNFAYYDEDQKKLLKGFSQYIRRVIADINTPEPLAKPVNHEPYNKNWRKISLMLHSDKVPSDAPEAEKEFIKNLWNLNQVLIGYRNKQGSEEYALLKSIDNNSLDGLDPESERYAEIDKAFNKVNELNDTFNNIKNNPDLNEMYFQITEKRLKAASVAPPQAAPQEAGPIPVQVAPPQQAAPTLPPRPPRPANLNRPAAAAPPIPTVESAPQQPAPPAPPTQEAKSKMPPPPPINVARVNQFIGDVITGPLVKQVSNMQPTITGDTGTIRVTNGALAAALKDQLFAGNATVKQVSKGEFDVEFNARIFVNTTATIHPNQRTAMATKITDGFIAESFKANDALVNQVQTALKTMRFSDEAKEGMSNLIKLIDNVKQSGGKSFETIALVERQANSLQDRFAKELSSMSAKVQPPEAPKEKKGGFMKFFTPKADGVAPASTVKDDVKFTGPKR